MRILSFELTMPNVGSWNGKWSGQKSKYYKHRRVSNEQAEKVMNGKQSNSFYYNFGDGWGANVRVEVVDAVEKKKREKVSAGFSTYEWMIDSILKHGKIIVESKQISEEEV